MIHQSFKSLFTDSSHVKFGRPLPLFSLPDRLITLLRTGASTGLRRICPKHLNDVARASPRLVPPPASCVCHRSRPNFFLCYHKSIIACASQLRLVVEHVVF
jgi:hypothetical protein